MKKAYKLVIKRYINNKLVSKKERWICSTCESGNVYRVKKKEAIYCRDCGSSSSIKTKHKEVK